MLDQRDGRGADWFLAHFNHTQEDTVGIEYPPKKPPAPEQGWSQAGCLIALLICGMTLVGVCAIGATMVAP